MITISELTPPRGARFWAYTNNRTNAKKNDASTHTFVEGAVIDNTRERPGQLDRAALSKRQPAKTWYWSRSHDEANFTRTGDTSKSTTLCMRTTESHGEPVPVPSTVPDRACCVAISRWVGAIVQADDGAIMELPDQLDRIVP